jgi:hypothetical protein
VFHQNAGFQRLLKWVKLLKIAPIELGLASCAANLVFVFSEV